MKKIHLFVLLLTVLFVTCKKYRDFEGDFDGNDRVQGRLFLLDPLSGKTSVEPLSGKTIRVFSAGITQPLVSIQTDAQGYFTLSNLNFSKHGYTFIYEEVVNDKRYRMEDTVTKANDSMACYARLSEKNQNGFYYLFTDKNGAPLPNCSVCVFSSLETTRTDTCTGSTWQFTSDPFGRVSMLNIPPITYYARISVNFQNPRAPMMDTIYVKKEGIEKKNKTIY